MNQLNNTVPDIPFFVAKKLLNTYPIQLVSEQRYWDHYFSVFRPFDISFQGLYFDTDQLTPDAAKLKLAAYDQSKHNFNRCFSEHFFVMNEEETEVIAIIIGKYVKVDTYMIQHCVTHPSYRQKGIYSAFINLLLSYTKELGFNKVTSTHSPSNNPILIANLKMGFYITSFEVDPEWGININTTYFHNEQVKRAFFLRCGDIDMTAAMKEASWDSVSRLVERIQNTA